MHPIWGGTIERKVFTSSDIVRKFKDIGRHVSARIEGYMVGSGAMSLRGDKEVTKDVDILFATEDEARIFCEALREDGFSHETELEGEYANIKTFAIMRDASMFWFDVYVERVAGWFYLSDSVKSRAEVWGSFGNFTLLLLSREDIFLSKSVTERARDLDDMATLYRRGIDSRIVLEECDVQSLNSNNAWHLSLAIRLEEMEEAFDISVPWRMKLREIGGRILLERKVLERLARGPMTVRDIADKSDVDERTTREVLKKLESEGKVDVERSVRPYVYSLSDSSSPPKT